MQYYFFSNLKNQELTWEQFLTEATITDKDKTRWIPQNVRQVLGQTLSKPVKLENIVQQEKARAEFSYFVEEF